MEPVTIGEGFLSIGRTILGLVGLFVRNLDFTYVPSQAPYLYTFNQVTWIPGKPDPATGNAVASQQDSRVRWYRVGIKNRTLATVDDVRVELTSIDPPVIGHLPLPLHIMHGAPQPLTVHRADEPTHFADVVFKYDLLDQIFISHGIDGAGNGIPAGRYRLGLRLTGRNTRPTTGHFIADVDAQNMLTFARE